MSQVPQEFIDLLPKIAAKTSHDPIYWLWVYDPQEDKAHVHHNRDKHRANHTDHEELGHKVPHPSRVHGYAYRIVGGFRITDWDHRPVADPRVSKRVHEALRQEIPKPSDDHRASVTQIRALL